MFDVHVYLKGGANDMYCYDALKHRVCILLVLRLVGQSGYFFFVTNKLSTGTLD